MDKPLSLNQPTLRLFMCLSMIPGLSMESPLGSGPAGTGIPVCFLMVRDLRLVSALGSASLAVLAGGGDTGDMTGTTTGSFSTITTTARTAEFSPISTTSIVPADFMAVVFPGAVVFPEAEVSPHRGTVSRRHMPRPAIIPVLSAALIMEEWREASLLADSRASVEGLTGVAAAVNSGQPPQTQLMIWRIKSCARII